ncbi:MAG: hypothetical protein U0872_12065 [Planctomycetaceae bacterium]
MLNLDRPTPERIAHALNLLSVSGDVWTLRAEIAWESRAGTVFQAACRFPDDWRIVNVEQLSAGPRRRELVGWKVQAHPESGQVLLLDFPDGLTPGRVEPIGIVARRVAEGPEAPQALPLFLPMDCESSNVVLAVAADVQTLFTSAQWTPFERFDGDSAAVWNTLPSWGNAQTPATPSRLLFRLTSADSLPFASSRLVREEIGAAEASVELTFGVERIEERWSIRLDSLPGDRRIELFFPSSAAGSEWSCGQDRPVSVTPERILSPTMSRPQLPPGGELWSIAVPPLEAGEPLLITGVLRRARTERDVVPLVFVPQATSFRGRVSIVSELTEPLEIRERAFPAEDGQSVDREAAVRRQEMLPESELWGTGPGIGNGPSVAIRRSSPLIAGRSLPWSRSCPPMHKGMTITSSGWTSATAPRAVNYEFDWITPPSSSPSYAMISAFRSPHPARKWWWRRRWMVKTGTSASCIACRFAGDCCVPIIG